MRATGTPVAELDRIAAGLHGGHDRCGNAPHAAAHVGPAAAVVGAPRVGDASHHVMQQHIGRAGRLDTGKSADDAVRGQRRLQGVRLKPVADEIGDRDRSQLQSR